MLGSSAFIKGEDPDWLEAGVAEPLGTDCTVSSALTDVLGYSAFIKGVDPDWLEAGVAEPLGSDCTVALTTTGLGTCTQLS